MMMKIKETYHYKAYIFILSEEVFDN